MTAFLFSAALTFALYQALAHSRFPPNWKVLRIGGGLRLVLSEGAARWARRLLRLAIIVAFTLFVFFIHPIFVPAWLSLKNSTAVIVGFLFGPLFAIWINTVINNKEPDLSSAQMVTGVGLALLFLLGAAGEKTAAWLAMSADSLSSIKLGGVEAQFDRHPKEAMRVMSTAPAGSDSASGGKVSPASAGSSGLSYLGQLDKIVERDQNYLRLFAVSGRPEPKSDPLSRSKKFAEAVAPPFNCLHTWLSETADGQAVNEHVTVFADSFRQIGLLHDAELRGRIPDVSRSFVDGELELLHDVMASTAQAEILDACKPLVERFCPDLAGRSSPFARPAALKCVEERLSQIEKLPENWSQAKPSNPLERALQDFRDTLSNFVESGGVKNRPYVPIAYSSILAQLGRHAAAAAILDDWLRRYRDAAPEGPHVNEWLALRARAILAVYLEEWVALEDAQATRAPTALRNEHLRNLIAVINGFKGLLRESDFFEGLENDSLRPEMRFRRPGKCASHEEPKKLDYWRNLYTSYISMEVTYVMTALRDPAYEEISAEALNTEVARLARFDLSCGADRPDPKIMYAQALEAFARNGLQYSGIHAEEEDKDITLRRLDEAKAAAEFGLDMINGVLSSQEPEARRDPTGFLQRIAPDQATEMKTRLKSVLGVIKWAKQKVNKP